VLAPGEGDSPLLPRLASNPGVVAVPDTNTR
jgi:hypothetical protein